MTATSQNRTIAFHPEALHMVIKAQAGSLQKAISEAVMNSIDAFATIVDIKLTQKGFIITDNGTGFSHKDEIENWFESIGFPHYESENHRRFGKFGMGRAQMWAYAKTIWKSNQFKMDVDVKMSGMEYKLEISNQPYLLGTEIVATFYEEISFSEVEFIEKQLKDLLKFAPAIVNLNGHSISINPEFEDWNIDLESAWVKADPSSNILSIYNNGVLVNHFVKGRYHPSFTGVIVTKDKYSLSLNIARTDILRECNVWKQIHSELPVDFKVKKPKKDKISNREAKNIGAQLKLGKITLNEALKNNHGFLTTIAGRSLAPNIAWGTRGTSVIAASPSKNPLAQKAFKLKLAMVISQESLDAANLTFEDFKSIWKRDISDLVNSNSGWYSTYLSDMLKNQEFVSDLSVKFPQLIENIDIISESKLKKNKLYELAGIKALNAMSYDFTKAFRQEAGIEKGNVEEFQPFNKYLAFESATDDNFMLLDGAGVGINIKKIDHYFRDGIPSCTWLVNSLLNFYLSKSGLGSDVLAKAITMDNKYYLLGVKLAMTYLRFAKLYNLTISKKISQSIDAVATSDDLEAISIPDIDDEEVSSLTA